MAQLSQVSGSSLVSCCFSFPSSFFTMCSVLPCLYLNNSLPVLLKQCTIKADILWHAFATCNSDWRAILFCSTSVQVFSSFFTLSLKPASVFTQALFSSLRLSLPDSQVLLCLPIASSSFCSKVSRCIDSNAMYAVHTINFLSHLLRFHCALKCFLCLL